ncbi:putative lipid II flippase FtsW [Candidatus Thiosymbion oneisti]|uniref:putative lipid II flippase FtsW n=1 Tax=Candidatus Thiosymbion oneisti TaxID=589554 RepID=UPI000AD328FB|nr:putative lipid II flippase FtsW [Candidatus Thiosymbion oneisti]
MSAEDRVPQADLNAHPDAAGKRADPASKASQRDRRQVGRLPDLDWPLLACVLMLLGFGFVMMSSASMPIADRTFAAPLHFVIRHALALGLAVTAGILVFATPLAWWERSGPTLFFLGLVLLVLVLVPGIGRTVNGASRWIPLGPLNLQSSEFMKFFAVIFVAGYLVRRREEVVTSLWGFLKPMILMVIASTLIMRQPDFGTTVILLATVLGLLFLGGVRLTHFAVLFGMLTMAAVILVALEPYRLERVTSFMNPFADPFDTGFQLSQALIAFGRGEWLGVGLGNGIQKQFFLPEAHTDFLMAVIGEELGLVGTLTVIAAFGFFLWRVLVIGARAERAGCWFAAYAAHGFGLGIGLQAMINIGVNLGLLPTKGLTLPFMSYGTNSIIVTCMAVGLLLRIDRDLRLGTVEQRSVEGMTWARA